MVMANLTVFFVEMVKRVTEAVSNSGEEHDAGGRADDQRGGAGDQVRRDRPPDHPGHARRDGAEVAAVCG
jgi:hypothetical protein